MRVDIRFKRGTSTEAYVRGIREIEPDDVSPVEAQQIIEAEQLLEKLTGLRVHIEQVNY